jgi:hypothetical protein
MIRRSIDTMSASNPTTYPLSLLVINFLSDFGRKFRRITSNRNPEIGIQKFWKG